MGWEDGIGFGGNSAVYDPFGERVVELDGLETDQRLLELDGSALRRARVETPLRRDEKPWILAGELTRHLPYTGASPDGGS